jgi:curli biogenesis system outer membrane secretion channel CsgG
LYDSGRFVVVDRDNDVYRYWYAPQTQGVMKEQDLAASGRMASASKVAQTGKMRPARYLAEADITEMTENQSGADGGIGFKGIRLGGGKSDAQIAIILKLVDTTTGEVVAKERIIGKAGNVSAKVGVSYHGLNTNAGGHKKTPLAQAAQDCVNQSVFFMVKAMKALPREGSVIKATSKGVIINRGSTYGVSIGQELIMQTEGEELMDPGTGESLGMEEGEVIGKLRVKSVKEKYSYCSVVEGEASPQPSTVVVFVDQNK